MIYFLDMELNYDLRFKIHTFSGGLYEIKVKGRPIPK
jgi:hypothetical protein